MLRSESRIRLYADCGGYLYRLSQMSASTLGCASEFPSTRGSLALLVLPDHRQKLLSVARQLGLADAVHLRHLAQGRRLAVDHVDQAAVGQHHIGGPRLPLGERRA